MAYHVSCSLNPDHIDLAFGTYRQEQRLQEDTVCQVTMEPGANLRSSPDTLEMEHLGDSRNFHRLQTRHNREVAERQEQLSPLTRNSWSAATRKVLSSMPSRCVVGQSRTEIFSQGTRRSTQMHRNQASFRGFASSRRTSVHGFNAQADCDDVDEAETKREEMVQNLQCLSLVDRQRLLREMPLSLAEKTQIRKLVSSGTMQDSLINRDVSFCCQLGVYIVRAWRNFMPSVLPILSSLQLWQLEMKKLGGHFGTGVVSYFLFLRALVFFNFFLVAINGLFLAFPQAVRPPSDNSDHKTFTGLELLTGTGYLSDSIMFYGYYTKTVVDTCTPASVRSKANNGLACDSINDTQTMAYNISLAYIITLSMTFFVTCIILVYSTSKAFGRSFQVLKSQGNLGVKVFCSWDFKVTKRNSVRLLSESISTHLKEVLSDTLCRKEKKSCLQWLWCIVSCLVSWAVCLGGILLGTMAIYYLNQSDHGPLKKTGDVRGSILDELNLLVLPAVVSGINLLLPGIFNLMGWFEGYDSPSVRVYVAIIRNLLLKVSVLAMLCYHWLGRIAAKPESHGLQCWESFVGQELYRFLLLDFIFTVLHTFLGEFVWRLFSIGVLKKNRKPVFDIARNVLELIYGQTLTWIGLLFAPLLPAVQIIKLMLLFYMKKGSLLLNCQASRKPWRASQMTTLFTSLLCFPSFVGAAVCITYTMWTVKPSTGCGPFQNMTSMIQSGKQWALNLETTNPTLSWMKWVYTYLVENPLFLFITSGLFLMVIYIHTQVVDGQRMIVSLLQQQIENEGKDKKFLINKLQTIYEQRNLMSPSRPQTSQS